MNRSAERSGLMEACRELGVDVSGVPPLGIRSADRKI